MRTLTRFICAIVVALAVISCNPQKRIAGNYSYKTECLNVELDGSQTVKCWGTGRNRSDAVEQAKKNAVRDVLFLGICNGNSDCNSKPVLNEVNVQEKHEDYFNVFFSDNGPYKNFVSCKDERLGSKIFKNRRKARQQITQGVIVRVDRSGLKKKMIEDGILKN